MTKEFEEWIIQEVTREELDDGDTYYSTEFVKAAFLAGQRIEREKIRRKNEEKTEG